VGIGCHGGRHRSVAIAEEVGRLVPGCKVTHWALLGRERMGGEEP